MIRVVHVITTTDVGGAEVLLARLLERQDRERFRSRVVSLAPTGAVGDRIAAGGIPVESLHMDPGRGAWAAFRRLVRRLRALRPDVVHTWMYHADLLGGLAARLARVPAVVWSLHQTDLPTRQIPTSTRTIARINARLSRVVPSAILCTSASSRDVHIDRGYDRRRMVLIPNGVPLRAVTPEEWGQLRAELGVPPDVPLVGRIGRFHPQKDHRTFVAAASVVHRRHPDVRFACVGRGTTDANRELVGWVEAVGLRDRFHLLGERPDADVVSAVFDVAVSSSAFGESTPLVVGEAMAVGVPVVSTDVGDSAAIVGPCGRVVPPGDGGALGRAIADVLDLPTDERRALAECGRTRVREHYDIELTVQRYGELYQRVTGRPA